MENVHSLFRRVRRLEIRTRRLVEQLVGGEYRSIFRGQGMEFSEFRAYNEGDDTRLIDWNVTARTGTPFVKLLTEERELQVLLMLDLSGSLRFGSTSLTKEERVAEVAALLALAAVRNGDRVGLLTFADDIIEYVPPDKGRTHAMVVVQKVLESRGRQSQADIDNALSRVGRILHRRALIFLISDFRFWGRPKLLRAASSRHDLVGIHVFDPRELSVPTIGHIRFKDPETGRIQLVDTNSPSWRKGFASRVAALQAEREALSRQNAFDLVSISTADDLVLPLRRFFEMRRRRRRH
ncbi:DUF58 domain-containing protein [Candidatus Fermentibacteria bacterium]|nr:DUF58 domain-containing protein [Candidatus Fermentibacteria bacterium]